MSEQERQERFLLTFDAIRGEAVKVEHLGEAGELTEVDLPWFVRLLMSGGPAASAPQQIVINIYGGAGQDTPVLEQAAGRPRLPMIYTDGIVAPHKIRKKE